MASGILDGMRHDVYVAKNSRLWFTALPGFGPDWRVTWRRALGWKMAEDLVLIPRRKLPVTFLTNLALVRMSILVKAAFSCVSVNLFFSLNQEAKFGQT